MAAALDKKSKRASALAVMLTSLAATCNALAAEPDYIGTWVANEAACNIAQDSEHAPLVIAKDHYDQHEAHCAFTSVKPDPPGSWTIAADCTVEGDTQSQVFTLAVTGNTMTWIEGTGALVWNRCK